MPRGSRGEFESERAAWQHLGRAEKPLDLVDGRTPYLRREVLASSPDESNVLDRVSLLPENAVVESGTLTGQEKGQPLLISIVVHVQEDLDAKKAFVAESPKTEVLKTCGKSAELAASRRILPQSAEDIEGQLLLEIGLLSQPRPFTRSLRGWRLCRALPLLGGCLQRSDNKLLELEGSFFSAKYKRDHAESGHGTCGPDTVSGSMALG
jgi:hypothetical protein